MPDGGMAEDFLHVAGLVQVSVGNGTMRPFLLVGIENTQRRSDYLHLIVNYLEYRADRELFGELKARQIMEFWSSDHYTWIYKTVLEHTRDIGNIAFKHKLIPASRS